ATRVAARIRMRLHLSLLALLIAACQHAAAPEPQRGAPGEGWAATSDSGRIVARLAPESGAVEVGRFQTWIVELREKGGAAVTGAQLAIDGGMPSHGHGLPTQPQVGEALGDGRYRIEGMKLNMYGDWVIVIGVQTATLRDRIRFDLAID